MLASEIIANSAVLLNDVAQSRFTNAVLLPYLKMAYKKLQLKLHILDAAPLAEVSTIITVSAGATNLGANQPADLIEPLRMKERANVSEAFVDMTKQEFEPETIPSSTLGYWTWREDIIVFPSALQSVQVQLTYLKAAATISSVNSNITIINADTYLEPMTASLAAKYIGEAYERGRELELEAERNIDLVIRRMVKKRQSFTARRRSFSRHLRS